jgi:hypothetical protein
MIKITDAVAQPGDLRDSHRRMSTGMLVLETSPGATPEGAVAHPVLFDGVVRRPEAVAAGLRSLFLLASARPAQTATGANPSFDPVLVAQGDRLRCEAISACGTVHARLDLLPGSLGDRAPGIGTAHLHGSRTLDLALAAIGPEASLHLQIGPERGEPDAASRCQPAPAATRPEGWARALAAAQRLARTFSLRTELDAPQWPQLAPSLALPGAAILAVLQPLAHLVECVRIHGPDATADAPSAASALEFELPGARFSLTFSSAPNRGFYGEGAAPEPPGLASATDVRAVAALLAWDARIDPEALAAQARLPRERIDRALAILAAEGQLGYDLHEQAWFHRPLPCGEDGARFHEPRLDSAKALLANGAVSPVEGGWWVRGEHGLYRLTRKSDRLQCTCEFEAKYRGTRGPCKHALAVQLHVRQPAPAAVA